MRRKPLLLAGLLSCSPALAQDGPLPLPSGSAHRWLFAGAGALAAGGLAAGGLAQAEVTRAAALRDAPALVRSERRAQALVDTSRWMFGVGALALVYGLVLELVPAGSDGPLVWRF